MRTLVAEETQVSAEADLRECIFFRHRPWMVSRELTEVGKSELSYLFCRRVRRQIAESWYYVTDSRPNSSLPRRDERDLRNRSWLILLRGKQELIRLKELLENRSKEIEITEAPVFAKGVDHLMNDVYRDLSSPFGLSSNGGAFPGLLDQYCWD